MSTVAELLKGFGPKVIAIVGILYILFGVFIYWQADPGTKLSLFLFEFTKSGGKTLNTTSETQLIANKRAESKSEPDELESACIESLTTGAEEEALYLTYSSPNALATEPRILCEKNFRTKNTLKSKVLFGRTLVMEGKRVEARAIFEEAAEQGDSHSHLVLGFIYSNYPDRVPTKALTNFLKAYIQGEPYGAYGLGKYLELGMHDLPDYSLAAVMYEIAAEAGVPEAQFRLGQLFQFGLGVPQNHDNAKRYLRRAAAAGNANAIRILEEYNEKSF